VDDVLALQQCRNIRGDCRIGDCGIGVVDVLSSGGSDCESSDEGGDGARAAGKIGVHGMHLNEIGSPCA